MCDDRHFIFYDSETTGTDIVFDQIIQFAAILTNSSFQELDRFEIRSRRLPWVVPAPSAMLLSGNLPEKLDNPALPTFPEMVDRIHSKLRQWSPGIFIGYNSIRFDEPLLQRAFWQCLFPPYLTVTDGNRRTDILLLARACSKIAAHALKIPNSASGRPSFKLDRLAPLNGLAHQNAHEALADVEATIHLARIIEARVPKLWSAALERTDRTFVDKVLRSLDATLVLEPDASGRAGWWGLPLMQDPEQSSAYLVVRLDRDWKGFSTKDERDRQKVFSSSPHLVRRIRANQGPLVFTRAAAKTLFGLFPTKAQLSTARAIAASPKLANEISAAYLESRPEWPLPRAIEQRIFESFAGTEDQKLLRRFHSIPWDKRASMIREFKDDRFQQLSQRLVFLMAPETLSRDGRARIRQGIKDRLDATHEYPSLWRTISQAQRDLEQFGSSDVDKKTIATIRTWFSELKRQTA